MNIEGFTFKQKVQVYFVCYDKIRMLNSKLKAISLDNKQERLAEEIRLELEENEKVAEMISEDTNLGNLRHVIHTISQEDNITYEEMEDIIGMKRGAVEQLTSNGSIETHELKKLCSYYKLEIDRYKQMYSY